MGTKDRKERDREKVKELILKAAREIFMEKGYEQTSIRNIADRAEYSPGTIYLYYKDKDSIFHELHKEGFITLGSRFAVLQSVADPFERLKAMARVYIDFSIEYPDFYDLMFIVRAPMDALGEQECWKEGDGAFQILIKVVKECMAMKKFKGHDPEELSFVIWAALHGMVTLRFRGRCKVVSEEKRESIEILGIATLNKLLEVS